MKAYVIQPAGGRPSYDLGECEKSIELSASAGPLADEIDEANYSYLALSLRGKRYLALGQYEPARTNVEHAIEKVEQVRNRVGGQEQQRATAAKLSQPSGVVVDSAGNVFIADTSNHRIRKVAAATGIITTVVGTGTQGFSGDGGRATVAELAGPADVAVDSAGNLFVADRGNHCIWKIAAGTAIINLIAGTGESGFSGDGGPASAARLYWPHGVAVDSGGNVFIADSFNSRIRVMRGPIP
jgi:DNA-binding beta-propeller fold protein YncE